MTRRQASRKHGMEKRRKTSTPKRWASLLPLVIVAAGLSVYLNSFSGAFVFDDAAHVLENDRIRQILPLSQTLSGHRPVIDLTLAINYALGELRVWGYHAVNVTVHILAALTLFGVVRRTLSRGELRERFGSVSHVLAAVVALLWVLHPLQTQSVTYVIQRSESLMGLFYLLTLYCVIRGVDSKRSVLWYCAAILCCWLGMGSKAVMVTAPVVLLLFDRTFLGKSLVEALRRRWGLYLGLAAGWGVLWLVGIARGVLDPATKNAHVGFGYQGIGPLEYLFTQFGVMVQYLRLSVWPDPLCLDYNWPVAQTLWKIIPPVILVGLLASVTGWAYFRKSPWGFVGAWFFVILLPTSSFIPIKDTLFEHRMYLPLASVLVLTVVGGYVVLPVLLGRFSVAAAARRRVMTGIVVVLVITSGVLTARRNATYHSPVTMWQDVAAKRPDNARAHENLGTALMVENRPLEAIEAYHEAIRLDRHYTTALANLANVLSQTNQFGEAVRYYEHVLRLDPNDVDAYVNLAHALEMLGRREEGTEVLRRGTRIDRAGVRPRELARVHLNLGSALGNQGDIDGAIAQYREALRIFPEYDNAHYWLGVALGQQGRRDEAARHFHEALRINPDHPGAKRALQQAGSVPGP